MHPLPSVHYLGEVSYDRTVSPFEPMTTDVFTIKTLTDQSLKEAHAFRSMHNLLYKSKLVSGALAGTVDCQI